MIQTFDTQRVEFITSALVIQVSDKRVQALSSCVGVLVSLVKIVEYVLAPNVENPAELVYGCVYVIVVGVWYAIEGYNFFKLRDLGERLDFAIGYDEAAKSISIDTAKERQDFVLDELIQSNYKENQATQKNISGLINDQNSSPVSDIKMGLYGSNNNGCGWIATYNAMYLLGEPQPPADIVNYYETVGGTVLNGLFGTNPFTVNQYFKDMGFETGYTSPPSKMDKEIADAGVAVLEYTNLPYLHYVAVYYENGVYTIYNSGATDSGKAVETASIDKWIEERGYAPVVLITVKRAC